MGAGRVYGLPSKTHTNTRRNFFANQVVKTWNSLPEDIVTSATLITFRHRLNHFDLRKVQNMVY